MNARTFQRSNVKIDWGIKPGSNRRARNLLRKPALRPLGPRVAVIASPLNLPYLGPFASTPQRILTAALERRGERVETEVPFAGGRSVAGGMVVDLWLPNRGVRGMVIRVQGDYWHSLDPTRARDTAQNVYLSARRIAVVDVWEHDILRRLKWVLQVQIGVSI